MGRWTNKDPIGFAGQQGNLYAYVDGEPVNRGDASGLADWFFGIEVDAIIEEKGGAVGLGVVLDTDHPSESGIYVTGGKGFGFNIGVGVGGGVCTRNIEGDGHEVDVNGAVLSGQFVSDGKGVCGGGVSYGPGIGGSIAKTKTATVSVKSIARGIARVYRRIRNAF